MTFGAPRSYSSRRSSSTSEIGSWLLANMPMRAQAGGIPLPQTYASVSTLRDGRVIRQHDFLDPSEALELVGLAGARAADPAGTP